MGKFLKFVPCVLNSDQIDIYNKKGEQLGTLEYLQVGRRKTWCFCHLPGLSYYEKVYLTGACVREVYEKLCEMNLAKYERRAVVRPPPVREEGLCVIRKGRA